jgi:hypothetical protein
MIRTADIIILTAILLISCGSQKPAGVTTIPYHVEPVSAQFIIDVDKKLADIQTKYNLTIYKSDFTVCQSMKAEYTWDFITPDDTDVIYHELDVFADNWNLLPQSFVTQSNLKGIAFVKNLESSLGTIRGGFDINDNIIMYASALVNVAFSEVYGDDWISHAILHEYCHLLENKFSYSAGYPEWTSLNTPGYVYGESSYDDWNLITQFHPQPGFVNKYCMVHYYEDRAETFAFMLVPKLKVKLTEWLAGDSYLTNKRNRIKADMMNLDPSLPGSFFD